MTHLTKDQAYAAMFAFLEDYYRRGKSDEIGNILGNMSLLADGTPADPAYVNDWDAAVQRALDGRVDTRFRIVPKKP